MLADTVSGLCAATTVRTQARSYVTWARLGCSEHQLARRGAAVPQDTASRLPASSSGAHAMAIPKGGASKTLRGPTSPLSWESYTAGHGEEDSSMRSLTYPILLEEKNKSTIKYILLLS